MECISQELNNDNQTVISDITESINDGNTSVNEYNEELLLNELKTNLNIELNKFTSDILREKCKELNITGISKLKKPELIQSLETEFLKLNDVLKNKKKNEIKNMIKIYGIKKLTSTRKEVLIYRILCYYLSNMIFKIDESKLQNETTVEPEPELEPEPEVKPLTLIEQLELQKQEIEKKMQEEIKKKEDEEKQKLEEQKRLEDEERKKKEEEEKKRIEEEKKEAKKKKQSIPKNVRVIVWNHYIGEDIIKHKCLCCKKVTISNTNFEVGHVLSEKNGGTHEINNLRPICFACNHSMGAENMIDFVVKFGLYIG